jgi:hypothetical protein
MYCAAVILKNHLSVRKAKLDVQKRSSLSLLSAGTQSLTLSPTYVRSGTTYIEHDFVSAKRLHSTHVKQKFSLKRSVIYHLKSGIYYAAIGKDIRSPTKDT